MSDNPEINAVRIDLNAAEAARTFAEALVGLFAPASQYLGLIGDRIQSERMEIAAAITRKAKAIADENGLLLTAPPLKFLAPFYEAASLEEEEELQSLWAGLLVSASSSYAANHGLFLDFLRKLSALDAMVIKQIASDAFNVDPRVYFLLRSAAPTTFRNILCRSRVGTAPDHEIPDLETFDELQNAVKRDGVRILEIYCREGGHIVRVLIAPDAWNASDVALEALGFFRRLSVEVELDNVTVDINCLETTPLLYRFYQACTAKISDEVRGPGGR